MTQEIIDTGDLPNDGSGDPLRAAFEKINNNFSNLFSTLGANLELIDTSAIDGEYIDPNNPQGQNIINIGQIVINNNLTDIYNILTLWIIWINVFAVNS
jgi:hypothetical protein